MVRRGSTSSISSGDSQQGPGLRRQSSSGSMSERTFRTSSPNRSSPIVKADPNAPPVPAIPKDVTNPGVHRRASSLEPPFRGASPGSRRGGGRGISADRTAVGPTDRAHAARVTSLYRVPEVDQENSTRSINFSRPISPQASSPVSLPRASHSGWFTAPVVGDQPFKGQPAIQPKTSDGLIVNGLSNVQQSIQNAADKPVSKRKTKVAQGVEGSRLASGSMGQRPTGAAVSAGPPLSSSTQPVDPNSPSSVYDPSTRTFRKKEESQGSQEAAHSVIELPQRPRQHIQSQPPATERPRSPPNNFQTQAGALLARQSFDDHGEEDQEISTPGASTGHELDSSQVDRPSDATIASSVSIAAPPLPAPETHHTRSVSQTTTQLPTNGTQNAKGRGSGRGERPQSLSPGRSARFAAVAVELPNGVRHQPPPRSVSPAKSAMKHSPSSSIRTSSPIANFIPGGGRGAPSEASDTMSEDGLKPPPRKKKNVRVSFDEDAVIAGPSAPLESPEASSPKGIELSKWNSRTSSSVEGDVDEVMAPRPALPSFGSIRGRSRRDDDDMAEKVTETVSSSMSASVSTMSEPLETSSDHALASIVTQDFASKQNSHAVINEQENSLSKSNVDPLPPEVTSVEGSGYVSDSDRSTTTQNEKPIAVNERPENQAHVNLVDQAVEPETVDGNAEAPKQPDIVVSSMAVLPATPAAGEESERMFVMPGGFPEQYEEPKSQSEVTGEDLPGNNDARNSTDSKHTTVVISEPSTRDTPASNSPQQLPLNYGDHLSVVHEDSDESDDSCSIYSDAAEDLSDMEEGAYASIDAVVESPIVPPVLGPAIPTPPDSPSSTLPPKQGNSSNVHPGQSRRLSPSNSDGDWDATKQYWSGLSETRKQEIEREAKDEPTEVVSTKAAVPILQAAKPKKKRSSIAGQTQGTSVPRFAKSIEPAIQHRTTQPRSSAMKKSMRPTPEPTAPEIQMKTMRSSDGSRTIPVSPSSETHLRKSMRNSDATRNSRKESGLSASKYSVPPVDSRELRGALRKGNVPPASSSPLKARPQTASGPPVTQSKPTQLPPLNRSISNDSDSDASVSSFRRQRRKSAIADGGRYTMRRSMRGGPEPSALAPTMRQKSVAIASPPPPTLRTSMRPTSPNSAQGSLGSSRFSVRSLSPSGGMIGKSGRNVSIGAGVPTLRSQAPLQTKSTSKILGFGKPAKSKTVAPLRAASRFKSRFADSSDEEDEFPTRFQSRFADSDDEDFELPAGLTPVRGIPRKPGDEDRDSTDLSDEDSNDELTAPGPSTKEIEKGAAPALTNDKAPGTFTAGSLRKSKYADGEPKSQPTKKSKRRFFNLGKKKSPTIQPTEDPTTEPMAVPQQGRPLTPVGEDKTLDATSPTLPTSLPHPRSPRLQRKSAPQRGRSTSDSWPLPQHPNTAEDIRPQSSDGAMATQKVLRPTLSKRHSSATAPPNIGVDPKTGKEVVFGRTGKKKKFPMLRKVFGLND
jgi:serine/arginine repetitive matrix protein 2